MEFKLIFEGKDVVLEGIKIDHVELLVLKGWKEHWKQDKLHGWSVCRSQLKSQIKH